MGTDYSRATLPFAVRGIVGVFESHIPDKLESHWEETIFQLHEHENEEIESPFNFFGWEYLYHKGGYKSDPNRLSDTGKHNDYSFSWKLSKGDKSVWLVQEGFQGYDDYYSLGAYTKEELQEFLTDIGFTELPIIERYVFFMVW